ncbi:hypothetical protein FKM82_001134 [Ascaphus truei]
MDILAMFQALGRTHIWAEWDGFRVCLPLWVLGTVSPLDCFSLTPPYILHFIFTLRCTDNCFLFVLVLPVFH